MTPAHPHLIIAAGGTGGHMFPAQALSEVMIRRGWRVTLSTDARGARYTDGYSHAVEVRQVGAATVLARIVAMVMDTGEVPAGRPAMTATH